MHDYERIDELLRLSGYPKPSRLDELLVDVNEKSTTYFGKYKNKALMVYGTKVGVGCTMTIAYTETAIRELEKLNEIREK